MHALFDILLEFSATLGYPGIIFLMSIESSFIPFPSELVVPPAAFLASQGQMNIYLVIFSGILGSLIGATFNYILALTLGRKIVFSLSNSRISKMLLINEKKIHNAEAYFLKYGNMSTFIGRLVPAVRQLISIPAGFSKMNFRHFIFFTFLGSGTWTIILAILGYQFGANQEKILQYSKEISYIFLIIFVIFISWIFIRYKNNNKRNNEKKD